MRTFDENAIVDAHKYVQDGRVVSKAELQRRLQNARTCYCHYKAKIKSLRAQLKRQASIVKTQSRILEMIAAALKKQKGATK